ncbi:MAG: metallophosphoesterase family protein, partial [Planctomyces sp.]
MANSDNTSSTVILHLTDLHFGWEGGPNAETLKAQRTNCLNALHTALKKLVADSSNTHWKPDIVAITGDLGWKGAAADYLLLNKWLEPLLQDLQLGHDSVVVCPGNHDIDRQKARYQGRPLTAKESDEL